MAKVIKYKFVSPDGHFSHDVEMWWSEANEEIAKAEAYNGEYIVEEVAEPEREPTPQEDADAMLVDHEYRLTLLELGLTE